MLAVSAFSVTAVGAATAQASPGAGLHTGVSQAAAPMRATFHEQRVRAMNGTTLRYLDDSFAYGLRSFPGNSSDFQLWTERTWDDLTRRLQNVVTGRCIDDSFEFGLRPYECNSSQYQSWLYLVRPDGWLTLQNQATGRVLDDSDYGLRAFTYYGPAAPYQAWSVY